MPNLARLDIPGDLHRTSFDTIDFEEVINIVDEKGGV
jgi:hypothetical protein